MDSSEIKKIINQINYYNDCAELRKTYLEKGVKFYDKDGWGYIKNRVKTYVKKNENQNI